MAKLLLGEPVAEALDAGTSARCALLRERGVAPALAVVRCGERPDALRYERRAAARGAALGVAVRSVALPEDAPREALLNALAALNADRSVHGVLLLRPLPEPLRPAEEALCEALDPRKDVDGCTSLSAAMLCGGSPQGFPPCTPAACMALLDHYGVPCAGRRAVVLGRSSVVGRPAAMLLLGRDATVTVCHSKTHDIPEITRQADIIISSAGKPGSLTAAHVRTGQTVLDVSMNWDARRGRMCGDAVFDEVQPVVEAITPVPGGVGAVTVSVLLRHTAEAAERSLAP